MPLTYHIDTDAGLINLSGQDTVALNDLVDCGNAVLNDDAFAPTLPQLVDLRSVRFALVPPGLYEQQALLLINRFNGVVNSSVAVVVSGGLPQPIIAEIYRITSQFSRAELFEDYDHAMRWLIKTAFAGTAAQVSAG